MTIFAEQLQYILRQHTKDLNNLYAVRIKGVHLSGEKIKRLMKVVNGRMISATLNPIEMEAVAQYFKFTADEKRRINSALAAEAIFRMMLDRHPTSELAIQQSENVFHLLFDADESSFKALQAQILADYSNPEVLPYQQ